MSENGAFRKKKVYFSQVSNEALRDNTLSLKAKGLYALIQSYITIENFTLYKNKLKKECKEGEKAFESTWKELKDKGYLVQYKLKKEDGTFCYEYDLLDVSNHTPKKEGVEKDVVEKADVEKALSGKGGVYNKTKENNTNLNNTKVSKHSSHTKKSNFNNFPQRQYNFDKLESGLLGYENVDISDTQEG